MAGSQIRKGDPRTCAIFIQAWGSNCGSLGFSQSQNTHGSSGANATCINWGLNVKIITCKTPHSGKIVDALLLRLFSHAWSAKIWKSSICAPWLTTPLHGAVYKVRISLVHLWSGFTSIPWAMAYTYHNRTMSSMPLSLHWYTCRSNYHIHYL